MSLFMDMSRLFRELMIALVALSVSYLNVRRKLQSPHNAELPQLTRPQPLSYLLDEISRLYASICLTVSQESVK